MRRHSIASRLGIGIATGFAIFVVAARYIGTFSFDYLLGFWIAQFPVAGWLGRTTRSLSRNANRSQASDTEPPFRSVSGAIVDDRGVRGSWWVLVPILTAVAVQLYAFHFSVLPYGIDASFHCVVAQRQIDAGKAVNDLWPLERLKLNYPIGSHVWLAVASQWTGLAVHEVFRHSFIFALCGSALVIAMWAERLFGTALHGVAASFAYVFCCPQASLFPYTWGGLPSLMAVWLGMAGLFCVVHLAGSTGVLLGALLFASTALVHHHTMVALLGGLSIIAVLGCAVFPAQRAVWRRLLVTSTAAAVIAGIYVVPLLMHVGEFTQTNVLTYTEDFNWPWRQLWVWYDDPMSVAFTLLNAVITSFAVVLGLRFRSNSELPGSRILLIALASFWLLSFCTLDYGLRLLGLILNRPASQPFTPSRFVFDAQFVFAIIAAGGLVRIWDWVRRPAFRFALAAAIACGAILQIEPRWQAKRDDALLPVGHWADRNLPSNSLIAGSNSVWTTYAFHRESCSLFIPISEVADADRMRLKQDLLREPTSHRWSEWKERLGKSLYVLGYSVDPNAKARPLFSSGIYALYDANEL